MAGMRVSTVGLGAASVIALALVLYWAIAPQADLTPIRATQANQRPIMQNHTDDQVSGPAPASIPDMLAGTSPPRLPLEAGGHLARTRTVRDFFDYFLTTRDDLPAADVDQLVRKSIAAQVDGIPAAAEALTIWQRYTAYRTALAQLPSPTSNTGSKLDFDALQLAIEQRASLADRLMGDWSEVFFGHELQRTRTDLARLRIMSDATLSEAEKSARSAALDAALPPEERAARERVQQQQASIAAIAQLQKQGASLDAIRAQVTQTLGPEAAERVVQMQQNEQAWQGKYADYAAQRAQIDRLNLSPQDRTAQVAQLRQQFFTSPGDAMRAASLDQGAEN